MIEVRAARPADAGLMAEVHRRADAASWSASEIAALMESPGVFGVIAAVGAAQGSFILFRLAADEAEVLTIATDPACRRRGAASALLRTSTAAAFAAGATSMFLEVAQDNAPARALYESHGFVVVGRRPRYYVRSGGAVDAMIMRLDLNR